MRKLLTTLAGMALLAAPMAAPAAAAVDEVPVPAHVEEQFLELFVERDIPDEHWDALMGKIRSGGLLDADSGAEPVSTTSVFRDGAWVDRLEFADHSVAFVEISSAAAPTKGGIGLLSISHKSCAIKMSSDFWTSKTGCRTVYDGISFSYSFLTDFRIRGGYNSNITRAYTPVVHRALLHSTGDRKATVVRAYSTSNVSAHARLSFSLSNNYTGSSRTIYLNMFLNRSGGLSGSTNL